MNMRLIMNEKEGVINIFNLFMQNEHGYNYEHSCSKSPLNINNYLHFGIDKTTNISMEQPPNNLASLKKRSQNYFALRA